MWAFTLLGQSRRNPELHSSRSFVKRLVLCGIFIVWEDEKESPGQKAPSLCYSDHGQSYEYVVKAGNTLIKCFSNYFFQPNGQFDLVEILVKDGKLKVESGQVVEIEVNIRRKGGHS